MKFLIIFILSSSPSHAAKYIIEIEGQAKLVKAEGFIPRNSIPAPAGNYAESDLSKVNNVWVVDNSKKSTRLAAEAQEKADAIAKRSQNESKKTELNRLYERIDATSLDRDVKDILKLIIELQFK